MSFGDQGGSERGEEALERADPRPDAPDAPEDVEHDADTLRSWSGDVDRRPQEGVQLPWWRRMFGR